MAETAHSQAGRAPGGASQRPSRVWYPLHPHTKDFGVGVNRCPECGSYTRIIRRPTGEVYLACRDRIECGYQETLE
ncbi:MAG: hypothetical protein HYY90_04765 [Candidatus Omnitrophica bacterium]|nr:hypothetical protein [Candidatus Omnitrophota bacterium]